MKIEKTQNLNDVYNTSTQNRAAVGEVVLSSREKAEIASAVDDAAKGRGVSRSRFISEAIRQLLHEPRVEVYRELDERIRVLVSCGNNPLMSELKSQREVISAIQRSIGAFGEEAGESGRMFRQLSTALFNQAVTHYEYLKFFLVVNLVLSALSTILLLMILYFDYYR
jgi:metal-responsive CopG/Arc/MetJ family transcriptional regulator